MEADSTTPSALLDVQLFAVKIEFPMNFERLLKALTEHDNMASHTCNFKYSNCGDTHMTG